MVRFDGSVETFVESAETLGRVGWLLAVLAVLFAAISVYGWAQGMTAEAARVGFLAVATAAVFVSTVVVQGWVGPWVGDRLRGLSYER